MLESHNPHKDALCFHEHFLGGFLTVSLLLLYGHIARKNTLLLHEQLFDVAIAYISMTLDART